MGWLWFDFWISGPDPQIQATHRNGGRQESQTVGGVLDVSLQSSIRPIQTNFQDTSQNISPFSLFLGANDLKLIDLLPISFGSTYDR